MKCVLSFILVLVFSFSVTSVDSEMLFVRSYSVLEDRVLETIYRECAFYGLDPHLIVSQIYVESSFRSHVVSHKGAIGLMQIMPDTGRYLAKRLGITIYNLYCPITNVKMGIFYMSLLVNRFGDYETALSAYFWGQTRVAKNKEKYRSTAYSKKVMNARW